MAGDRPLLGIALMICFCALAPMGDAIAKLLGGVVPLIQLLLVRFAIQAILLLPVLILRPAGRQSPQVWAMIVWRTALHIAGIGCMFTALRFLPLADAVAIAFVMPFIMLLLGRWFLNEAVGSRRLAACVVGFIGTLMVVQPSFVNVGPPALLPLAVALIFALFILATRQLSRKIDAISLQALSGSLATVGFLVLLAIPGLDVADAMLTPPPADALPYLAAVGVIGTVAHLLMTWSLRFAPAATLAPVQYLEIPFATLIGLAVFGDLPNGLAALGIAITMAAGLYIVFRERAQARLVPAET